MGKATEKNGKGKGKVREGEGTGRREMGLGLADHMENRMWSKCF